jgi:hypothetical protein
MEDHARQGGRRLPPTRGVGARYATGGGTTGCPVRPRARKPDRGPGTEDIWAAPPGCWQLV